MPTNTPSTSSRGDNELLSTAFSELRNIDLAPFAGNPTGAVTPATNKPPFACGSAMAPKALRGMGAISSTTVLSKIISKADLDRLVTKLSDITYSGADPSPSG